MQLRDHTLKSLKQLGEHNSKPPIWGEKNILTSLRQPKEHN
jgi:hypothetical protein